MERWFGNDVHQPFQPLMTGHIVILTLFAAGILILLFSYRTLKRSSLYRNWIRWTLFSILLISEATYQLFAITNDIWSTREFVPLHLCGVASILAMIALVTQNKALIQFNFFIGIIPAFLALLTPELPNAFPHYRFLKFFSHHMAISWASLFLILTSPVTITFRSLLGTFGILNLYAVFVFFINREIGSNYLFLSRAPTADTPLDLLGSGIWYYINLELLAFSIFLLLYGGYRLSQSPKNPFKDTPA
ncbi:MULTISPECIES: YwaF family protein [Pontibacillus]|uniref:TIGR02206 family membrane protein n=1 Tax=Pontibacillus chungwhensis TaxID=265426 RepID=A0ABY8UZG3_9BACI|nr:MULTISPECIES: TIGR02206 family membrane protein [Pontibacillus]MCD5324003.1 TIGR02206 family membrane protein [Pontibacillus sp. HN14]WIF97934.1 TIGR02206 family membrane protein [Pontibacillus chungwhensis]